MTQNENEIIQELLTYLINKKPPLDGHMEIGQHLSKTHHCGHDDTMFILAKAEVYKLIIHERVGYMLTQEGIKAKNMGVENYLKEKMNLESLDIDAKQSIIRSNILNRAVLWLTIAILISSIILGILNLIC